MKRYAIILLSMASVAVLSLSCKNGKNDFPNFDYSTAYFPTTTPIRTIVLGEDDIVDNSLDKQGKFKVYATLGGMYANDGRVELGIEVDNTLCDNLFYEDKTSPVEALPSNYYSLGSDKIVMDKTLQDGVVVTLTDDFFADPLSLEKNYVLPLVITSFSGVDSVLVGEPLVSDPILTNISHWYTFPKNYVLYGVKFINKYEANYLRRGVDVITNNGAETTVTRAEDEVEDDEVFKVESASLMTNTFPLTFTVTEGGADTQVTCDVTLTFDEDGTCSVSTSSADFTASGSGKYVFDGEKLSWGNKDRDALYLDYTIKYKTNVFECATKDTLVMRDRGVAPEYFSPFYI